MSTFISLFMPKHSIRMSSYSSVMLWSAQICSHLLLPWVGHLGELVSTSLWYDGMIHPTCVSFLYDHQSYRFLAVHLSWNFSLYSFRNSKIADISERFHMIGVNQYSGMTFAQFKFLTSRDENGPTSQPTTTVKLGTPELQSVTWKLRRAVASCCCSRSH